MATSTIIGIYDIIIIAVLVALLLLLRSNSKLKGNLKELAPKLNQLNNIVDPENGLEKRTQEKIDIWKVTSAEDLENIGKNIINRAKDTSIGITREEIRSNSVPREEFERLQDAVHKLGVWETYAERMELAQKIFDSDKLLVLSWQGRLIKLLNKGLAPDTEEGTMTNLGIPITEATTFLEKLRGLEIIDRGEVDAYWMKPDYSWLESFAQDPYWLKNQLEDVVKKEKEYQEYIRNNMIRIEKRLTVINEQDQVPSGKIDILATDKDGKYVVLELKYPAASGRAFSQLLGYRNDLKKRADVGDVRCILVSPKISETIKKQLVDNKMEWKELSPPQ